MSEMFYAKTPTGAYSITDNLPCYSLLRSFVLSDYHVGNISSPAFSQSVEYSFYIIPVSVGNTITFESTNDLSANICFTKFAMGGKCYIQAERKDLGSNPNQYAQYILCREFSNSAAVTSTGKYGLDIYGANGNLIFSSNQKSLKGNVYNIATSYDYAYDDSIDQAFPRRDYTSTEDIAISCAMDCRLHYFAYGSMSPIVMGGYFTTLNSKKSISMTGRFFEASALYRLNNSYPMSLFAAKTSTVFIANTTNF